MGWSPGTGPTNGADIFVGTAGDDTADALGGSDHLSGGLGNDELSDERGGNDTLLGEGGNDTLFVSRGVFASIGLSTIVMNGGEGNDTLALHGTSNVQKPITATLIGGDGDDRIHVLGGATTATIDAGAGSDSVVLIGAGAITLTLGSGVDVLRLGDLGEPIIGPYVVTDFAAGVGGDQLDLVDWFTSEFTNWDSSNPFGASGHARLVQDGTATLLQVDYDGGANNFVTVLRFSDTSVGAFTSENTAGFIPTGAPAQDLTLIGTLNADVLEGADGDDHIEGLDGNDILRGGAGDDVIDGGAGDDRIEGGVGLDLLNGGAGADYLSANGGATIHGGDGNDEIWFGGASAPSGHAFAYGDAGDDTITAISSAGAFQISAFGGEGNDGFTVGGIGALTLDGGAGDDTFTINTVGAPTTLTLGSGNDRIILTASTVITQPIVITDFEGGPDGDVIEMMDYLDAVLTSWNHQTNPFGAGVARLVETSGDTKLQLFCGGVWHDTLIFQDIDAAFLLQENLSGLPGDGATPTVVTINGEEGDDWLIGGFGPNIIYGGEGRDYIEGGRGADIIYGGPDGDELRGGDGDDTIIAGGGHAYFSSGDDVIGGAGADTFIFQRGDGRLTIHDFQPGVDHIVVYGYSGGTITQDSQSAGLSFGDGASGITLLFPGGPVSLSDITFYPPPTIPAAPVINAPAGVSPGATIDLTADLTIGAGQTFYANAMVFDHDGSPLINVSNSGSIVSITNGFALNASGIGGPLFNPVANISVVNEASGIIRVRASGESSAALGVRVRDVVNHGVIEVVGHQAVAVTSDLGFVNSATGVVRVRGDLNTTAVTVGLNFHNAGLIEAYGPHRVSAVTGAMESWVNTGIIRAYSEERSIGVFANGGSHFINAGRIEADAAFFTSTNNDKTIENTGHIIGDIELLGGDDSITNTNEIIGAIALGEGNDAIVNAGQIEGDIYLGDGEDRYDGAEGDLAGAIYAGYGDDVVVLGNAGGWVYGGEGADRITGGAGDDFVDGGRGDDLLEGGDGNDTLSFATSSMAMTIDLSQTTVSSPGGVDTISGFENVVGTNYGDAISGSSGDNEIRGGEGEDAILGAGGDDILVGGAGHDLLSGGVGSDRFVFVRGDGQDIVTDFDPTQDHIEVWGYANYASLQQVGADVLVLLSPYNSLLLRNTSVTALSAANFTFHTELPVADEPVQAAGAGDESVFLVDEDYHVAIGEEIHFVGVRVGYRWLSDGTLNPISTVTNNGFIHLTAHSSLVGVSANFFNNEDGRLLVELIGESMDDPRTATGIGSGAKFYSAINYGHIEIHSSGDARAGSELARFENHGVVRVTAEKEAIGVWGWDSPLDFVNTGVFEIVGGWDSATGYQVLVGGGVFNNSGVFRVSCSEKNSVAIDFGYNGQVQVFTNSGTIEAVYAIIGSGDGVMWGVAHVENTGEIHGIVQLGRGADRIVNHGLMTGGISLGDGDDQYVGADGELVGGVFGDAGNDIIATGDGGDQLQGGAGYDTLDGGGGVDTASYWVASTFVTWARDASGAWTVNAGSDGVDTLRNVEILQFTDRNVVLDKAQQTFSGNGTSDFLWRNANHGTVVVWEMSGASQQSAAIAGGAPSNWSIVAVGDIDGDGKDDLLWQNSVDGGVAGWLMNGATATSIAMVGGAPGVWQVAGMGDFNFDGKDDLVWRNTSDGAVAVWLMNGLTSHSDAIISGAPIAWDIAGIGDLDGDGRDDILLRHSDGTLARWTTDGVTQSSATIVGGAPNQWQIAGIGDFDGDTRADILWRNSEDGSLSLWRMNGSTTLGVSVIGGAPLDWSVAQIGDFNGDGKDDIVWRHTDGTLALWVMNGFNVTSTSVIGAVPTDWDLI